MAITSWFCALEFMCIGIYSLKKKEPMHFWSSETFVDKYKLKNVPAYNKENAIMWCAYGSVFIIIGIISLLGYSILSGVLIGVTILIGIPLLMLSYRKIYRKYIKLI